ncbi:uncharacterized protein LOC128892956 [Hylaeus anthracinus]|uniref:uncharacterized protein LOC128892956 n=1 Tax=Hylaeus anthracinus TaxID=313031 RepID=UPI0023B88975|nr:uncharacterized protein LOC128892956 [Hylaeus anthracinus]
MKGNSSMQEEVNNSNVVNDASKGNNSLTMQPPTTIPKPRTPCTPNGLGMRKLIPVTQSQFNEALSKFNSNKTVHLKPNKEVPTVRDTNISPIKKVSNVKITTKVPVLKITINKKYKKPPMINLDRIKHEQDISIHTDHSKVKKCYTNNRVKADLKNCVQNIFASPKPPVTNSVPVSLEKPDIKCEITTTETKSVCTPKAAYTRKGDLSRHNSRNQSSAEKIRYLYSKAQRDCDILRIRLKALKGRHKEEKEEMQKLQIHLNNHYKNLAEKSCESMKQFKKKKLYVSLENPEEKDEYEKLLREVRKIKQDLLNPNYPVKKLNRKLAQTNVFNRNKNKISKEYKRLTINNIAGTNDTNNGNTNIEVYDIDIEASNDFVKKSHCEIESDNIIIIKSEIGEELVLMES